MALNRQKLANNLKAGSSFMNITSKYRSLSIQARAAAVANVVLNFIFIRIFGYVAAVEQSLRKKFKKSIWSKFTKAINTYELVKPGGQNRSLHFRRKRFDADGEMLLGVKAPQQI